MNDSRRVVYIDLVEALKLLLPNVWIWRLWLRHTVTHSYTDLGLPVWTVSSSVRGLS